MFLFFVTLLGHFYIFNNNPKTDTVKKYVRTLHANCFNLRKISQMRKLNPILIFLSLIIFLMIKVMVEEEFLRTWNSKPRVSGQVYENYCFSGDFYLIMNSLSHDWVSVNIIYTDKV